MSQDGVVVFFRNKTNWLYESHCKPNKSNICYKWRWDKADTYGYYLQTFQYLSAIEVPVYLLHTDGLHDYCTKDIQITINSFYQSIVYALIGASAACMPRKHREFLQRVSIACYAERCISHSKSVRLSVCPSDRPSVTRWH